MQKRSPRMGRRRFLKTGGTGLAAFASSSIWAKPMDGRAETLRSEPSNPVVLKSL